MSNIATLFKEEISRLSRKEVRSETDNLKKSSSQYRTDIASLKRRVDANEKQLSRLTKQISTQIDVSSNSDVKTRARFTAKGFKTLRLRLGLTADVLAGLLGVSSVTIYGWEAGKSKPREAQLVKIVALREMGKKDVAAILQRLSDKYKV
ncbi:MAG: helix-turn-helix transcriptional regulator [Sideroxydans sp.]|jgi:DNA-binding transcriptional regulator YiaG